jgi:deazaflavin-dependent oxidoreductase (nitroreductase family)
MLVLMLQRVGVGLGRVQVLTTVGRRTGQFRKVPVGVVSIDGQRYIVQAYPNAAWVANARTTATATLAHGRRSTAVRLIELPVEQRRPLLRKHLMGSPPRVGRLLVTTGLVDDPTPDAVAAAAGRIAVFRIETA